MPFYRIFFLYLCKYSIANCITAMQENFILEGNNSCSRAWVKLGFFFHFHLWEYQLCKAAEMIWENQINLTGNWQIDLRKKKSLEPMESSKISTFFIFFCINTQQLNVIDCQLFPVFPCAGNLSTSSGCTEPFTVAWLISSAVMSWQLPMDSRVGTEKML